MVLTSEAPAAVVEVALVDVAVADVIGMVTVDGVRRLVVDPPPHATTTSALKTAITTRYATGDDCPPTAKPALSER